jgi:FixJ family two-component response regulator
LMNAPLIAIVDDDASIRVALEDLLGSLGWRTCMFASAEAFLNSAVLSEIRCMILDVHMPDMSGIELQEQLIDRRLDIPIIFITAFPDETTKSRALKSGAVEFLYKPIDLNERRLVSCLHKALNKGS